MLAKSKLNSIETLMSQALIDLDNEKEKYEQVKESIRNIKRRNELSENNKMITKNSRNTNLKKIYFFCFAYIKWLKSLKKHEKKWCRSNSLLGKKVAE